MRRSLRVCGSTLQPPAVASHSRGHALWSLRMSLRRALRGNHQPQQLGLQSVRCDITQSSRRDTPSCRSSGERPLGWRGAQAATPRSCLAPGKGRYILSQGMLMVLICYQAFIPRLAFTPPGL